MNFQFFAFIIFLFSTNCQSSKTNAGSVQNSVQNSVQINTNQGEETKVITTNPTPQKLVIAAEKTAEYLPLLQGKKVALVVNQTSLIGTTHLADSLQSLGVNITKIFSPEHGFRGEVSAGEHIKDGKDAKTGISLLSLYGNKKKPVAEDLKDVDVVVFDIQDVGARFYTYISTLFYVMEACADYQKTLLVLDRPNPNGHYVDGPMLKSGYESFVGIAQIPLVHGCTVGELAQLFEGEKMIKTNKKLDYKVIKCSNYTHDNTRYILPVKPSPNLPNIRSIYLYPSLCWFEGTVMSVGRGTDFPFQTIGHPEYHDDKFFFVPKTNEGAKMPPFENKTCWGIDFRNLDLEELSKEKQLNLRYLIDTYQKMEDKKSFFLANNFFDKLAGSNELRLQIQSGVGEEAIRKSWEVDLVAFKDLRKKYLIYE
jgi:uncharacterized protein YbbC (DUF1343 family)